MTPERYQQVAALLEAARDNRAVLDGTDPELRREVESLLEHDGASLPSLPGLADDSTVTQLAVGSQLGPYRIEALLSAGGMGKVYRAVDTRLGRNVAIKISSKEFTDRFQGEALAISALNHPHICTLYDVGPNYLVMELVEGETLAARLKKGKLSIEDTLLYGGQIAAALAEAHSKGVTHSDLKPGNVMIGKNGVKVLDFGLANVAPASAGESMTVSQAIMGTPAYMAPEQREGKPCDARTDIYALGLVLREMAEDPPPYLVHVIDRCLATDPENRWQSARDAQLELAWEPPNPPQAKAYATWPWMAVAAVAVLVAAVGWWYATRPASPRPVTRWTATLPASDARGSGLSISRDGTRLAYDGGSGSSRRIWVRLLDQPEAKPIPGTEGGLRPFFSPDGQWLAYFAGVVGALKKVPVTGGPSTTLCEEATFVGGSWGEDDRIIFHGSSGGLMRVSASGGACESLTTADRQEGDTSHAWPQVLPGGQSVLFTIGTPGSFDSARIAVLDLKSGRIRVLLNGGTSGRYVPSGHLVYARGGVLFAVPFDLNGLAVTGSEAPVVEGLLYNSAGGFADYAFSDSGLLVYREETRSALRTLAWLDRTGTAQPLPAPPQDYQRVRLSPDGQRAAVAVRRGGFWDIWILELSRGALTRLTTEGTHGSPVWTPDGRQVASGFLGTRVLHRTLADGSGKPELILDGEAGLPDSWTPDGKTLLYESAEPPAQVWTLQPSASGGDGKPRLLWDATAFNERDAQVSPDGRWVAYTSDESGKNRVYARPFPRASSEPGGKTPISIEGGEEPRWSRDGRELFYRDPEKNQLMAVDVQTSPAFRIGQAHALFALGNVPWDVAPDGKRFLVVKEPEGPESEAKLQAVVNWFEELRQKAPKK